MKVTNTKTETTMYDTNGKKVSIVRKEILEVDTTTHLLTREEGKQVNEKVTVYKTNLSNAQSVKTQLEKVQGSKKGRQIFHSMADLIMVVDRKVTPGSNLLEHHIDTIVSTTMNLNFNSGKADLFWEAANSEYKTDTKIKSKDSKKKK